MSTKFKELNELDKLSNSPFSEGFLGLDLKMPLKLLRRVLKDFGAESTLLIFPLSLRLPMATDFLDPASRDAKGWI